MAGSITIDPDVISSHAQRVEQVAADIKKALDAASGANVSGGAFGVMCAFLVPVAMLVSKEAGSAISSAESMVTRSASELKAVVDDFTKLEDALSSDLKKIQSGLEG
jgi:hypothetical protein